MTSESRPATKPTLILLPNVIGDQKDHTIFLPAGVQHAVARLDGLIAESVQGGRSYLNRFKTKKPPYQIPLALLNEHTPAADIDFILKPMREGQCWGLISDSGLPCVADPGSQLVFRARQLGIAIEALMGPSSLLLALMLSGLPGQRFSFHGYLPKDPDKLRKQLKLMEKRSADEQATQIFIEAPYRNCATLQAICETLNNSTLLCVAWDLTLPTQGVVCSTLEAFKKSPLPAIDKRPAIFLIQNCAKSDK